jgi:glycosyltransferase involved in cell wall biosynthesis
MSVSALVIIPTYNERANLPTLIEGLMQHADVRALVVDDQSPDGTGEVANALAREHPGRVSVLHRTGKRGFGRSYIDGMKHAVTEPVDVLCQMDADLSHDPRELPNLLAATAHADVVIGSRYVPGDCELAATPEIIEPLRQHLYPTGDEAQRAGLHIGVSLLAAARAGVASARRVLLGWLFVPGRDAVRRCAARLPNRRGPDHVRRAA